MGKVEVFFSFGNPFEDFLTTLRLKSRGYLQNRILEMKTENLQKPILAITSQTKHRTSSFWTLDPSTLDLKLVFDLDSPAEIIIPSVLEFRDLVSLDETRILITTGTYSLILDTAQEKIVSKVAHCLSINLRCFNCTSLDDLLVWSSPLFIHIAKFKTTENETKIDFVKDYYLDQYFNESEYEFRPTSNMFLFRFSSGDYAIYFMNSSYIGRYGHIIVTGPNRLIIDQNSLKVKESSTLSLGKRFLYKPDQKFKFYQALDDFLVFPLEQKKPNFNFSVNHGRNREQVSYRLHLTTLEFELLDCSNTIVYNRTPYVSPMLSIYEDHIISLASDNRLLLHQINTVAKKMILTKIVDLEGLKIPLSFTHLNNSFALFCEPKSPLHSNLRIILKLSAGLRLLGSFTGRNLNHVRGLMVRDSGRVGFSTRTYGSPPVRLGLMSNEFEIDFEEQKLIQLKTRDISPSGELPTGVFQSDSIVVVKTDNKEFVLYKLDR